MRRWGINISRKQATQDDTWQVFADRQRSCIYHLLFCITIYIYLIHFVKTTFQELFSDHAKDQSFLLCVSAWHHLSLSTCLYMVCLPSVGTILEGRKYNQLVISQRFWYRGLKSPGSIKKMGMQHWINYWNTPVRTLFSNMHYWSQFFRLGGMYEDAVRLLL